MRNPAPQIFRKRFPFASPGRRSMRREVPEFVHGTSPPPMNSYTRRYIFHTLSVLANTGRPSRRMPGSFSALRLGQQCNCLPLILHRRQTERFHILCRLCHGPCTTLGCSCPRYLASERTSLIWVMGSGE